VSHVPRASFALKYLGVPYPQGLPPGAVGTTVQPGPEEQCGYRTPTGLQALRKDLFLALKKGLLLALPSKEGLLSSKMSVVVPARRHVYQCRIPHEPNGCLYGASQCSYNQVPKMGATRDRPRGTELLKGTQRLTLNMSHSNGLSRGDFRAAGLPCQVTHCNNWTPHFPEASGTRYSSDG
jgi:hypothetical protein